MICVSPETSLRSWPGLTIWRFAESWGCPNGWMIYSWGLPLMGVSPKVAGWFMSWKIRSENGMIWGSPYFRKPPFHGKSCQNEWQLEVLPGRKLHILETRNDHCWCTCSQPRKDWLNIDQHWMPDSLCTSCVIGRLFVSSCVLQEVSNVKMHVSFGSDNRTIQYQDIYQRII